MRPLKRSTMPFVCVQPLAHPDAARDLGQVQGFLEEAVTTKRFDGFKVALAETQQPDHRLHDVRGAHAPRYRQARVDHRFNLRRLTALTDQRQSGIRGQVQLASLADFKARHGQLGEEWRCGIVTKNQIVEFDL